MKAREVKRAKLVARYAEKRAALKKVIATSEDPAEAYEAARKLQSIPKNANPIRLHNRCIKAMLLYGLFVIVYSAMLLSLELLPKERTG